MKICLGGISKFLSELSGDRMEMMTARLLNHPENLAFYFLEGGNPVPRKITLPRDDEGAAADSDSLLPRDDH